MAFLKLSEALVEAFVSAAFEARASRSRPGLDPGCGFPGMHSAQGAAYDRVTRALSDDLCLALDGWAAQLELASQREEAAIQVGQARLRVVEGGDPANLSARFANKRRRATPV